MGGWERVKKCVRGMSGREGDCRKGRERDEWREG